VSRWMMVGAPALLVVAGISGCGGDGRPRTEPVTGVVTLDGDPVEGALVSFSPEGGSGQSAVGTTDASGRYQLTTFRQGDGAVEGTYTLTVAKWDGVAPIPAQTEAPAEQRDYSDGDYGDAYTPPDAAPPPPPKNLLPEKYNSPRTSELNYTVTRGENTYDIPLTK
jgi:hypothetical protein